jgi:hypothetical protein
MLEQIGEADMKTAFAEPDRCIQRGESTEADIKRRDGSSWTKLAVFLLKDGDQVVWSDDGST